MKPRILILSTESFHHTYFINNMLRKWEVVGVFYETDRVRFPFGTLSPFEQEEARYEKENFFSQIDSEIPKSVPVFHVSSMNSPEAHALLAEQDYDLGFVFGCGRISGNTIALFKSSFLNIHRGDSSRYRGLDSDLWAIYHDDFESIGATLHEVDARLDTGAVVKTGSIVLRPDLEIWQIRYETTLLATDQALKAAQARSEGHLKSSPQTKLGRYYSAMPTDLKAWCSARFKQRLNRRFV